MVLSALIAGCGGGDARPPEPAPAGPAPPAHLVLISLDTLRADGVGALRRGRPSISPALDRFTADAVLFDQAVAPMAFTLPSHMSMFTGLDPGVHRVTTERDQLSPAIPTLAERLQQGGFETVGRITNEWLKPEFGFGRGFDSYERLRHELTYADRVCDAGFEALEQADREGRRAFVFLHYMDPHSDFPFGRNRLPYFSPLRFRQKIAPDLADTRFCDAEDRCSTAFLEAADREGRQVPAGEVAAIHGLYEAGLRYLDRELGRFFDRLREAGLYDRSLIVVVSDHGEEFREHGMFLHSQTYEESVAVPLLIKLPASRLGGTRVRALVEVQDLYPTLLELAGLPAGDRVQGVSLVPLIESAGERGPLPNRVPNRAALLQDKLVRSRFALRTARWKVIYDFADEHTELYDLKDDPGETHDLSVADAARTERMRGRLKRVLRDNRALAQELVAAAPAAGGDTLLTDEERERLKSLGYLQ